MEREPIPNLSHLIPEETGNKQCFLLLSPLLLAEKWRQIKADKLGDGHLRYLCFFVKLLPDSCQELALSTNHCSLVICRTLQHIFAWYAQAFSSPVLQLTLTQCKL